jgi:hypothetical protein
MSQFAIACYRPKPGMDEALLDVVRTHYETLRAAGFVSEKPPYLMRAKDGTLIEVFEWKSVEAKELAHKDPSVGQLWGRFSACADFPPLTEIAEAQQRFVNFEAVKL